MDEGVFFPRFWPAEWVRNWLSSFMNPIVGQSTPIKINHQGERWLPLSVIRNVRQSQPSSYDNLMRSFQQYGISVNLARHGEVTQSFQWRDGLTVVTAVNQADRDDFQHSRYLDSDRFQNWQFDQLSPFENMRGLVLDSALLFDPLFDLKKRSLLLAQSNIGLTKTPFATTLLDPERVRIESTFDTVKDALVMQRLFEAGIDYVDQFTPENIKTLIKLPGMSPKKQQTIQNIYQDLHGTEVPGVDFKPAVPYAVVKARTAKNQSINQKIAQQFMTRDTIVLRAFAQAQVFDFEDLTEAKLAQIFQTPGIGMVKQRRIREWWDHLRRKEETPFSQAIYLPLMPLLRQLWPKARKLVEPLTMDNDKYVTKLSRHMHRYAEDWTPTFQAGFKWMDIMYEPDKNPTDAKDVSANLLRQALTLDFAGLGDRSAQFNEVSDEVLLASWAYFRQLRPNTVTADMQAFFIAISEKYPPIFEIYLQESDEPMPKTFTSEHELTASEFVDMERAVPKLFKTWWQDHRMTLKLLVATKCQVIRLDEILPPKFADLIVSVILTHQPVLQKLWLTRSSYLAKNRKTKKSRPHRIS
ncbi:MAG: hypothetical protein LKF36_07870 [Lactobacillus sp.]|nr:hypothetical protein [Lactobacillus sp.]